VKTFEILKPSLKGQKGKAKTEKAKTEKAKKPRKAPAKKGKKEDTDSMKDFIEDSEEEPVKKKK